MVVGAAAYVASVRGEVSLVRCNDREVRVSYEQYEKEKNK